MSKSKVARTTRISARCNIESLERAVVHRKVALVDLIDNRAAGMLASFPDKALDALIVAEGRLNKAHSANRVVTS